MIERIPQFGVRTLLLVTTLAALVVYSFTMLGMLSGLSTIVFSVVFLGQKSKKARVGVVIALLFFMLVCTRIGLRTIDSANFRPSPWNGKACIGILLTGRDFKQRKDVFHLLKSKLKNVSVSPGSEVLQPFFSAACIKLHLDEEQLTAVESKVRQLIEESFPDLSVEIESHPASE